jgi:cell filamentation protein
MSDDRYEVFDDPYCYKGTSVLRNKAGLRDDDLLTNFELEMTTLRAREPLPDGAFDPAHYRAIHRHLFQDVYTWAGKYRTVRMTRGGNPFCYPEYIEAQANSLFVRLGDDVFQGGATRGAFVEAASEFLAELNVIHCFRDGNGRAQLTLMHLIAQRAGHPLKLEHVKRATFLPAMIESFAGDLTKLRKEIGALCRQDRRV